MGSGGHGGYRPSPEMANLHRQTERIAELEAVLRKVRDDLRDAHLGEGYQVNLREIADHIATVLK